MSQHAPDLTPIEDIDDVLNSENLRRHKARIYWVIGSVLAIAAVVVLVGRALDPAGPAYESTVVSATDLEVIVTAVGTIEPLHEVEVGSELSGIVTEVAVQAGDLVEEGQVLAKLDPAVLRAQVEQARAQVKAAEASLVQVQAGATLALRDRDIATELAARGAQPEDNKARASSAYEQATAAAGAAKAQVRAARAVLRLAEVNLAKTVVTAPIAGVVLTRNAEVGQAVVSSLQAYTLFVIAQDLGNMQVVLDIDEADIRRVRAGQPVRFTVAAYPHRTFEGTLIHVGLAPKPMSQVVTYEALVAVDNEDKSLVPGMTASASVVADMHEDVLVVPNGALRFRPSGVEAPAAADGFGTLWVRGDADVTPLPVQLGATDGRVTVVQGELTPGMDVLLSEQSP